MKKEIFDWYEERYLPVHRQITLGQKFGLSKFHVEAAMVHCYNKIVNEDKKIPGCQIAWYIRNVAKNIDTSGIEEDHRLIENAKADIAKLNTKHEQLISQHKSEIQKLHADNRAGKEQLISQHNLELQELHDDNKLKLRETTESYVNIINNKNDELRKNKASYEAEIGRSKASREALKKKLENRVSEEIAVTKFMSASIFKLKDRLESERKKAKRIATFYYIFTMMSLIQAGLWLL